jgi:hypothetical protein
MINVFGAIIANIAENVKPSPDLERAQVELLGMGVNNESESSICERVRTAPRQVEDSDILALRNAITRLTIRRVERNQAGD